MQPEQMRSTYDKYVKGWSNVSDTERMELVKASIAPKAFTQTRFHA